MSEKKVIGTDNSGKSKIRVKSGYSITLIKSAAFNETDIDYDEDIDFKNIFEFIQYIIDHGKDMLEDIDNGEYEYDLQINLEEKDFAYMSIISGDSSIGLEIDASFIENEIRGDKQALHDIMDIAYKRTNWGQVRK